MSFFVGDGLQPQERIAHLPLCITGVNIAAMKDDHWIRSVERLILQPADCTTIHSIGEGSGEFFYIEAQCAASCLFIRREAEAYLAVPDFRMAQQIFRCTHDGCNACLVVGTEQRHTVRDKNILATICGQLWKFTRGKHDALRRVQHDITAVIGSDDTRPHRPARRVGTRIEMRDETDDRSLPAAIRRQRSHEVAMIIERDFRESKLSQLSR